MRKLLLALLAFVLASLSLATATYSWITLARTNIIDEIALFATLGDGFEISVDGENYYEVLPKNVLLRGLRTAKLLEVTSQDGITFTHKDDDVDVVKNRDYLSFEFYFRTNSKREHDIYLANNVSSTATYDNTPTEGTFVTSKGITFRSPITYTYDIDDIVNVGDVRTYHASGAVRISTVVDHDGILESKIFDLSGNEHRGFGKPYGSVSYYTNRLQMPLTIPEEIPPTIYQLSEFEPNAPFALDDNSYLTTLKETVIINGETYYQGKIKVNIWLEGWDADLFDPVLTDRIKIQLQFKAVRKK